MAIFVEVECDQKCERCDKSFMCLYYLTTVKKSKELIAEEDLIRFFKPLAREGVPENAGKK